MFTHLFFHEEISAYFFIAALSQQNLALFIFGSFQLVLKILFYVLL